MAREWERWVPKIWDMAHALGFSPRDTLFYEVDADTIYQQAAYLYPGMFASWQAGRDYWRMKHSMEHGGGYIYELVVETTPAIAYLTNRNKLADHITVISHVAGHSEVFAHNRLFEQTRPDIGDYLRAASERFTEYEAQYGIDRLEPLMDLGYALMLHSTDVAPAQKLHETDKGAAPFADIAQIGVSTRERESERKKDERAKERERERYENGVPCPDILYYLAYHAPIEDWQRDVLSVFRELGRSLQRRIRTKVLNEGTAMLIEDKILQAMELPQDMVIDQSKGTAYVTLPGPLRINPYWLGWRLLQHIEGQGIDVREVVRQETDLSLLRNYVDEAFVAQHRLYEWHIKRGWNGQQQVAEAHVKSRKWEEVRDSLIRLHTHEQPEVVVANVNRFGTLELEADGPLDTQDAQDIIDGISVLWRRKVVIKLGSDENAALLASD